MSQRCCLDYAARGKSRSLLLQGLELLVDECFEAWPRQSSFDHVALVLAIGESRPDHEGGRGADVVQSRLRNVGVDQRLGGLSLDAGLESCAVKVLLFGDCLDPFAVKAALLIENCSVQLPVAVLLPCAAACSSGSSGVLVIGEGQIFVDETDQPWPDVSLLQLGQNLLMKALAVRALKVTEFHDGERCQW